MAQKYIVLGTKPKGDVEILAGPSVPPQKQKEVLAKNSNNSSFTEVQMFSLEPFSRSFHPANAAAVKAKLAEAEKKKKQEEAEAEKKKIQTNKQTEE